MKYFCLAWLAGCSALSAAEPQEFEFFEKKIRPVLVQHCYECHGSETQEGGLRLDTFQGMVKGGASGPAVVPKNIEQSLLLMAVNYQQSDLQMPPEGKLDAAILRDLQHWIQQGAVHPERDGVALPTSGQLDLETARQHWAYQSFPSSKSEDPNLIDELIDQRLSAVGLARNPRADKRTLIRRVTFDLTGLPPTREEVDAFLADDTPRAWETLVERLLASPHYGEHWGRHWLDVARYADSNGLDENVAHGNAWRYRDYVIQAFNSDKPFDQFILEQIAGDLLPAADETQRHEQLIGTGFLTLGPKVLAESDETKMEMDIIDEQIDTIGKTFLGLTLGCARCHDHKFDPIQTSDYYALAGIFKSTRTMESLKRIAKWNENTIASADQLLAKENYDKALAAAETAVKTLEAKIKEASAVSTVTPKSTDAPTAEVAANEDRTTAQEPGENTETVADAKELPSNDADVPSLEELQKQLAAEKERLTELKQQPVTLPMAMGVVDAEPKDLPVHLRGSHLALAKEAVPRSVPVLLRSDEFAIPETHSGRLELAEWLTSPENPLTARVIVNRIWGWHFGKGLHESTENFGKLGGKPTHPELLDWLAGQFVARDWSVKSLHRLILLSETYQQCSTFSAEHAEIDPENRLLWRQRILRLPAESIRDSILAVSGRLDEERGGSLLHVGNREFIFNHTSKDETNYSSTKRSVYLPVIRNNLYDGFSLFDYNDASVPNGSRGTSIVAPQALFLMNSELVLTSAEALAQRTLDAAAEDRERIKWLFETVFARSPSDSELASSLNLIQQFEDQLGWSILTHALLESNEFIYIR